ncbi:succinylglutamate desuccinylase/aspartoacylase family protein [Puniceicoccus vermicola]|uniref:Succinylglutamate desuccinylase/aspartoacylase family protein n=1 Tax=Puniceicoccus vermicola TaxID=388746 RepID=A0A7X1AYR4_9BACT|nr:succinylglutamate desuccinylase/aspartoacylase family protein [Puniceicoccus vermicola]MBC2602372.1 succinylglutamate desuccinylase/aspartoacylase family protein [Puniceicoccus vermicola]
MSKLDSLIAKTQEGKNSKFSLFEATISPGETASLGLPLPEMLGYAPLYMPVKVINGKQAGPTVLAFATMRGDEFNGMEILKQLVGMPLLEKLHGTLIIVPVLNVFGMLNRSSTLPDGHTLEGNFPGSPDGNYTQRTANLFYENLFKSCDVCLELSSGNINHNFLPHTHADFSNPANRELSQSFPVSVSVDIEPEEGSLQACAKEAGIPMLMYRAGEAMRFNPHAIRLGKRGILGLLRRLKMLPEPERGRVKEAHSPILSEASDWVHATKSGIAHPQVRLGDRVNRGDILAIISEPLGSFQEVKVKSPVDGVIVGTNDMPLVFEGDFLFRIATFKELDDVADRLQKWVGELPISAGEAATSSSGETTSGTFGEISEKTSS